MPNFTSLIKKKWFPLAAAIAVIAIANIAVFWKFYFNGLLPIPGNLLVSFFFPWSGGGFIGFDPWTTHKGFIGSDAIRQMYPWKVFIFDTLRSGHLPLWNPYNFSGYPFFGNLQSAFLFPGNLLFLIFNPLVSWMILVIGSLSVFGLFNYLFLRSLKLSLPASILGALVGSTLSYLVVWQEQLIMIQVVIFLPLILWSINKYCEKKHPEIFFFLIPIFLCFAIFGGHAQTYIYLNFIIGSYLLIKKVPLKNIIFFLGFPVFLGAIQLFPTIENYLHSAREGVSTQDLFDPFILPWKHLATIFASDYFGNSATGNYSSKFYGDFQAFITVTGITFSIVAIFNCYRNKVVQLFIVLSLVGILFATVPFAYLYKNIPIMDSGAPSRFIFLFQFSGVVLSAFGLDFLWNFDSKQKKLKLILPIVTIGLIYFFLTVNARLNNDLVAVKNLFLPTGVALILLLVISTKLFKSFPSKVSTGLLLLALPLIILESSYFLNKYIPFSNKDFAFPQHPLINFLQNEAGYDRFYGLGSAYFDNNFATYYQIFSAEGYDSLMVKRYEQLLASSENGKITNKIFRSDAKFPTQENDFRNRIFDILGIKYLLNKDDTINGKWNPDLNKFPNDRYKLVWQKDKSQIYERKTSLPRVFLTGQYEVFSDDNELINRLYDPIFDYRQILLLPKKPSFDSHIGGGEAKIISYFPDRVEVQTKASSNELLFLSDTYFSGWHATVDGKPTEIFQADYDFRAVTVPTGKHLIVFTYAPMSVISGGTVSLFSLVGLFLITYLIFKKN